MDQMGLIAQGSVEDITTQFPEIDMIYVFFGALNTVDDLESAFFAVSRTFVNKFYIAGTLIANQARWKKSLGGLFANEFFGEKTIKKFAFADTVFSILRGIIMLHKRLPRSIIQGLWELDERITTLGKFGEYMLYTFEKSD